MEILIDVFVKILDDSQAEGALRVSLEVNIQSWQSTGKVRQLFPVIQKEIHDVLLKHTKTNVVAELNPTETDEMTRFLEVLLSGSTLDFNCLSAITFAAASAIQRVGVYINAKSPRQTEGELVVTYQQGLVAPGATIPQRDLIRRSQIVSYPAGKAKSMIEALRTSIDDRNKFEEF
ncbi:hypothetical protein F5B20DRAFT_594838 [Whalleya microplaca]|nr:hypothetical protein F5B20DRAFT_594838 [Whalleya microplaca]